MFQSSILLTDFQSNLFQFSNFGFQLLHMSFFPLPECSLRSPILRLPFLQSAKNYYSVLRKNSQRETLNGPELLILIYRNRCRGGASYSVLPVENGFSFAVDGCRWRFVYSVLHSLHGTYHRSHLEMHHYHLNIINTSPVRAGQGRGVLENEAWSRSADCSGLLSKGSK